jgi:hypothetical protein
MRRSYKCLGHPLSTACFLNQIIRRTNVIPKQANPGNARPGQASCHPLGRVFFVLASPAGPERGVVGRGIIIAGVKVDPPIIYNAYPGAGLDVRDIEIAWNGPPQCRYCSIRDLVLFADLRHDDFQLIHKPVDELSFGVGETLYRLADHQWVH